MQTLLLPHAKYHHHRYLQVLQDTKDCSFDQTVPPELMYAGRRELGGHSHKGGAASAIDL
jgi:hypothetical protein